MLERDTGEFEYGQGSASSPTAMLSPREHEVLAMAATGLTNTEIAKQLKVTTHAVKFHLAAIYRKLGATNRTQAAAIFLRSSQRATEKHA